MDGAPLLANYMREHRITATALGKALGVTHGAVVRWRDGEVEPDHSNRQALDKFTGGAVPYASWPSSREEAERLKDIAPFAA
jgi:hypothetical protein